MRFFLNNPPRWLARALAVVNGKTQTEIENTLYPVVEVAQAGWGLDAKVESFQTDGSLVGPVIETITASDFEAKRVLFQCNNPGTAAIVVFAALRRGTGVSVQLTAFSIAAGTNGTWGLLGGGRDWFVVPPGCSLEINQAQYTTTAGFIRVMEVTHPAGVNLS